MQTKNLPFFFLSFFLFGSIVTNAIGYYLLLLLYPMIYIIRARIQIPKYVYHIGYLMLAMYLSFIVSNFLNFIFQNPNMPASFYQEYSLSPLLFTSIFPKVYLGTGLYLIVLVFLSNRVKFHSTEGLEFIDPFKAFCKGSLWTGIFVSIFFFLEYLYNIDYRVLFGFKPFVVPFDLQGTLYRRPRGLLQNPLTVTSMSLAYFTFFYTYFCLCFFGKKSTLMLPFSQEKIKLFLYTFLPSMLFFFILLLTVSRSGTFIGFIFLLLIPLCAVSKKNFFSVFLFILFVCLIGGIIADQLGYIDRLIQNFHEYTVNGYVDTRVYLQKVHIKLFIDKPLIGNGYYWLQHHGYADLGIRDKYYVLLGYANFVERNYSPHNTYLSVLASGGIFCALIVFYSVLRILKLFKMLVLRYSPEKKILWLSFVFSLIPNLLHALTMDNFLEASTTYTYFYLFFVIFWSTLKPSNEALS